MGDKLSTVRCARVLLAINVVIDDIVAAMSTRATSISTRVKPASAGLGSFKDDNVHSSRQPIDANLITNTCAA